MSTNQLKAAAGGAVAAAPRPTTIAGLLSDPKIKNQMALALPKHMTADRLARIALTEVRKNPALAKCDQASFLGAIMQCAQLGLEPGGALGHAYLLPFENRKKGITEVQFIVGYRGMIDLSRRSGQIVSLSAQVAYENDDFLYKLGLTPDIQHTPANTERGKMTHVYAVANLKGGGVQFEVMSLYDVNKIKAQSKASSFGPWVSHFEEMAKKTVIRRLFKYLPVSIEVAQLVGNDELVDVGLPQDNPLTVDADTGEWTGGDTEAGNIQSNDSEKTSVAAAQKSQDEINVANGGGLTVETLIDEMQSTTGKDGGHLLLDEGRSALTAADYQKLKAVFDAKYLD